jgi:hypothetical protein
MDFHRIDPDTGDLGKLSGFPDTPDASKNGRSSGLRKLPSFKLGAVCCTGQCTVLYSTVLEYSTHASHNTNRRVHVS